MHVWRRSIAQCVRRANFLGRPEYLFNLTDLVEPDHCPECGFDFRLFVLPAAWKALFRERLQDLADEQDRN